jgi:hypothetical protein
VYYKTGNRISIRTPAYTAKVLSYFGLINMDLINEAEKINISGEKTGNEDLIYKCFDELISKKEFIGLYLNEFRNEFKISEPLPF